MCTLYEGEIIENYINWNTPYMCICVCAVRAADRKHEWLRLSPHIDIVVVQMISCKSIWQIEFDQVDDNIIDKSKSCFYFE